MDRVGLPPTNTPTPCADSGGRRRLRAFRAAPARSLSNDVTEDDAFQRLAESTHASQADVAGVLTFLQWWQRPELYGLSRRFDTMPFRASEQACRNMRGPSAAYMCSEKISTDPALRM